MSSDTTSNATGRSGLRVLVAEDNLLNQKVTAAFLDHLGHECILVGDGNQALEQIIGGDFDVALIDIQIPGLNGMEVAGRIRSTESESTLPRLVALTAMVRADGQDFYRANGFDSYLSKPLTIARLAQELALID